MKDAQIKAKDGKDATTAKEVTATVQFPETLKEATEVYGEANVLSNALANWTVTLQSAIRRYTHAGKTPEEIQGLLAGAKMGAALERVTDPKAAMLAKFQAMNPEERAAYIKDLQTLANA